MKDKRFAIVGGGIGGLTTAIALQRYGYQVTVYENAPGIKPLGAGLALAANAVKAFNEIGIGREVLQAGKVLKALRIKSPDGKILSETDSEKISAKLKIVNNFTIHRADLHAVLLSQLAPGTVLLNKGCVDFVQRKSNVTLQFHDGSSSDADYVIACDGVHSVIRKKLLPLSYPRYSGYTCWRGVTDHIPPGVDMDETSETWGRGHRFGIAPLSNNRIYWFACMNARQNDPAMKARRIDDLVGDFRDFHFPVPHLLRNTAQENLIWSDIIDLRPIRQFAFGNILLMGDAAHATTPNMGQGACMAIEDAAVLANCLQKNLAEAAFISFEQKRIQRTTAIVKQSWRIGKLAQLENPILIALRNFAVRNTPASVVEKQVGFITGISFT